MANARNPGRIKTLNKRMPALGFRFSNAVDNLLDILVLVLLVLGIALISIAFSFSFTPRWIVSGLSELGLEPFSLATEDFVRQTQSASLVTLGRVIAITAPLVIFVALKRWVLTPLTRGEFALLFLLASPLPLWLLVNFFSLKICIFPLSQMSSSGASLLGRAPGNFVRCEALIEAGNSPIQSAYGAAMSLYALALVPLNLAALSALGLVQIQRSGAAGLRLRSLIWPWRFLAHLWPAARSRASRADLRSIFWLLCLAIAMPIIVFFPLLPDPFDFEVRAIIDLQPKYIANTELSDFMIGMYLSNGRQLLAVVVLVLLWLLFRRRWLAVLSILVLAALYPIVLGLLLNNFYLQLATSGYFSVVLFLGLIVGWMAYVTSYPSLRQLLDLAFSTLALAAKRAAKDVRATDAAIIYLRPFKLDAVEVPTLLSVALRMAAAQPRRRTIESAMADAAFKFAPLVALGGRSLEVEPVGALREYTSEEVWRSRLAELLRRPRAVLFLVGATESTREEVEMIMRHGLLAKTIFVLPPDAKLVREFFAENTELAARLGLDGYALEDGMARGWVALWTSSDGVHRALRAGRRDELSYKLAVARALSEIIA